MNLRQVGLGHPPNVLGPQVRIWPGFPRVSANFSEIVSSVLVLNLTNAEDYGTFTCSVWNVSSHSFTLWRAGEGVQGGGGQGLPVVLTLKE